MQFNMPSSSIDRETTSVIDDAWIREHYSRIYRAAWLMTGDRPTAEDLAQETFVVAIHSRNRFRGHSSEATWLYGILVRLQKKHWRSLARWKRRLVAYVESGDRDLNHGDSGEDPQSVMAAEQWRDSIWADVARLPIEQRMAVTLRFAEGMSYDQIAKAVNCASGTAKSRVHHGLKKLRETLSSDVREPFSSFGESAGSERIREFGNSPHNQREETKLKNQNACVQNGYGSRDGKESLMPCPFDSASLIARRP